MPDVPTQRQKAETLRALHRAPRILVLPNAWDAASAMVFALEGFRAIGTTSAGIAASLGCADGERMRLAENMQVVQRIVASSDRPVSADVEAGYSASVEGVVTTARAVLAAGAVGLNLEDSTGDPAAPLLEPAVQEHRLRAIRALDSDTGIPLVINARTDVYLHDADPARSLRNAIARGNAYREAGADCIFVPDLGNLDRQAIAVLVQEIDAPVNIFVRATTPSIPELQDLGVARVSFGPGAMNAALGLVRRIARELTTSGTYGLLTDAPVTYAEVNQWFGRGAAAHDHGADGKGRV